jgi:lipopolysaccharide transport system ATP-binding protein
LEGAQSATSVFGGSKNQEKDLPMSSNNIVIDVLNLSKRYDIYATPRDRLKQLLLPSIYRIFTRITDFFGRASERTPPQYFREFWALRNVSFHVRKGETLGIVGRNGSGKSTLLQLICSTLAPTGGDIIVKGRISALLELGSGFNPEYTGRENVFLNGQILGLSQKEIESRYETIVEFADIGDFIDQPVKTYSSGMAVRLAFAVAINVDPEILVIDEALAVGDVGFQARCFAKINELRQQGVTLLFVSHSPGAVTQLCNRAILLDRGELLLLGTPYQTISAYNYLASAGPTSFKNVREEIIALSEAENSTAANSSKEIVPKHSSVSHGEGSSPSIEAFFDEQLENSIKPLPFDQRGGEIISVSVTDLAGQTVNILPIHQKFVLRFNVRFDTAFENVRFAWVIKTTNGLILGGGSTHPPGSGIIIAGATSLFVTSHFMNIFTPGDYLIDIGVRGKIETDNEFIHGIINAIGIRSACYSLDYRNGIVDCLVDPTFTLEETSERPVSISTPGLRIRSLQRS